MIIKIQSWIEKEYDSGRQTSISDEEMLSLIEKLAPGRFVR